MEDAVPCLFGGLGEPEQLAIFSFNDAFVSQEISVEGTTPIPFAYELGGQGLDFAGLHKSEDFEQLVECAIASWESGQRLLSVGAAASCAAQTSASGSRGPA